MTRPLRILHIASGDLWAGAEVQAFTLMSWLARMPETQVAAVLMNNKTLAEKLRSTGISTYVLDEAKVNSFGLFVRLRGVLRTWQPDVVHTHRQKENILGSLASRSFRNVPSIRTVHGANELSTSTGLRGVRQRLVRDLDGWCGRALQRKIIAVTQALAVQMTGEFPAEKIVVVENGVDFEELRSKKSVAEYRAREPDATHIGIAGRLVGVKRVDLFIETAALLLREHPERDWRFHIFGDGPMRRSLEALARRLEMGGKAVFHGHRDDIATCVGGLDALVICSDHEGMPMISLEAAALGVPTVAHAVGGLLEVVPEEFLVPAHDSFGYRDGIMRALRADAHGAMVRQATKAAARFSARGNAERMRAVYEQVVAERSDMPSAKKRPSSSDCRAP
jgi:L-malate glycosyltransferase